MSAYDDLIAYQRETEALAQVAGRLGWDQETVMPRGAAPQRAEEMGAIEAVLHARRTDPRLGDWLAAIDSGALDEAGRANVRLIRRSYERNVKVPADLASEIARVTSRAQGIWAAAREDEDFAAFVPTLEKVVSLRRQEAQALAGGGDPYDALLDDYEPGATGTELEAMFAALRPRLVDEVVAFQNRYLTLQHIAGGVGAAGVDVARLLAGGNAFGLGHVLEDEG